ncbi:GAF domain-containing protein [Methanoplanus sp. FWC-SCC4]|uniref:histidine kinase n=1 Tax=Methanochimaera problematica TaxID=2609417 RepID=A0AA97FD49_9EURY|nr:ATP-binding protein [Methanoplanus sp. FWC-SCC4]WOF16677.1 GAF domain-containing protein [Methanoplanus sp. FWC-SCC4]
MPDYIPDHENLKKFLDDMDLPYIIADADHRIVCAGKEVSLITGGGMDLFEGNSLYSPDVGIFDKNEIKPVIDNLIYDEESFSSRVLCRFQSIDGLKYISADLRKIPGKNFSEKMIMITLRDDTERNEAILDIRTLNRKLHIINQIMNASVSAKTPSDALNNVVSKTVELMEFDAGALYCIDKNNKKADLTSYYGLYQLYFPKVLTPDICRPPHNEVFLNKKPCYLEEYLGVPHEEGEMGVFSVASVPVTVDGKVIGSLNIATSSFHKFSPEEKETLEAIGQHTGGIIRSAYLQEDLIRANENANLYLDIMMHDISNANMISMGYAELLSDVGGETSENSRKAICGIEKSIDIINNVSIIRKCRDDLPELKSLSVDEVIGREMSHLPDADFDYTSCGFRVLADELLNEVFANLFGNSVKFGGSDVKIYVDCKDCGDYLRVSVADDGPGIFDEQKPVVFERFSKGKLNKSGKGLGLCIVKMVLERYGSDIFVTDRIEGDFSSGAKFVFDLKKL